MTSMKPSIRKSDAGWKVTRPGFGFNPDPQVSLWPTWKEALGSLRTAPASAGAQVTDGTQAPKPWAPARGALRITAGPMREDT